MTGDPGGLRRSYLPIGAYALIGDCHTAALVSRDGSVDWYCPGRFDAPAVFCRLLDAERGGFLQIVPTRRFVAARRYIGATNVLETTFQTDSGRVRLLDFMPIYRRRSSYDGYDVGTRDRLVRLIEGVAGTIELELCFRPSFDYARVEGRLTEAPPHGIVASGGSKPLALACPGFQLEIDGEAARGRLLVQAGARHRVALSSMEVQDDPLKVLAFPGDPDELEATQRYWEKWAARCTYDGPYHDQVVRSALVLKLLDHEPSGALIAAPTTSLPEEIAGVRNWDYRYTWLRDSALVLYALHMIGYGEEAMDFFDWLEHLSIQNRSGMPIVYAVNGRAIPPERSLDHLEGYRASRPVRIGNAAADQIQVDVYGAVLDVAHLCHEMMDHPIRKELGTALRFMADSAAERWPEPDRSIWEVRGEPRHFLYSKLLCWVALDRALALSDARGLEGDHRRWKDAREEIRRAILSEGYDARVGAFTQALGAPALDASALVIPLVGFLPATDPRVLSTMDRIRERLTSQGLVYRYLTDDGIPGGEATFALCSFWLVDNLALAGRVDEARTLFERLIGFANDVGLMAEQIDPVAGELLGNFPQAFTHLALIRSALHLEQAANPVRRKP